MLNKKAAIVTLFTILFVCLGCSTKKNTPITRFYHSMTARFNIYYNGKVAYNEGIKELDDANKDFYIEKIPMFPIGNKASVGNGSSKFDIAIEKSQKAIKLHSIKKKPKRNAKKMRDPKYKLWLSKKEYNPFLDNAWLLMGKAQFQKGEFIEAASTFSYTARIYQTEPKVMAQAQIWLAECYSQLDWLYDAEDILSKVNNDTLPKELENKYIAATANMLIKQEKFAEAIPYLEKTAKNEKKKLYKARYYYLLGQLKQHTGDDNGAYKAFSKCRKLNAQYELTLSATIRQTEVIPQKEIPSALKRMNRMARQGKNKAYIEQIYYAIGNIYLNQKDTAQAIANYSKGAEKSENTTVEKGILLLRLGDLYWAQNEYSKAQEAYKEALSMLDSDFDGYEELDKRSAILDELVEHAEAVELQDSLQHLAKLPKEEQLEIIKKIIEEVIRQEEEMRKEEERQKLLAEREENMGEFSSMNNESQTTPTINTGDKSWYFYNVQLVTQGKNEFAKRWGRRKLEDNWRRANKTIINMDDEMGYDYSEEATDSLGNPIEMNDSIMQDTTTIDNKNPEYYLRQLPVTEEQIAESNNIIKDGLFNMGIIYKNKLEDYPHALQAFERLYTQYPEYENMDEVYYNLYLMCMIWKKPDKAEEYKQMLINSFPDSKYALVLNDPDYLFNIKYGKQIEDSLYAATYNAFKDGDFKMVKENYDISTNKYAMGVNRPKFIFLYAMSQLNDGDQKGFLTTLKDLVTKYPENEITEIAEGIIKGSQDGKILQGAMLGSIWSRRNINLEEEMADSTKIEKFSDEKETPFIFILAYEENKVNENLLLYRMAKYNFSSFVVKNFDLEFETINGIRILKTTTFTNFVEANQYIKLLYSNPEMAGHLSGLKAIIISETNFELLKKYYSFEDYEKFYNETFAQLPLPQIEGIIFDQPDYEELEEEGYLQDEVEEEVFIK